MKEFTKLCPKCERPQYYGCKNSLLYAIENNKICVKCVVDKSKKHWNKFERICKCGKLLKYSCRQSLNLANKHNSMCRNCATKQSARFIDRTYQTTRRYKKMMSEKIKRAWKSSKNYGSDSHREKLRIAKLNQIRIQGTQRTYNPNACKFIEKFGKINGYDFQHAMNGGEVIVCGYSLDGYDKEKNVVFEYDEPKHNIFSMKKSDKIREEKIINRIRPLAFFRYNEKQRHLYDVLESVG